MTADAILARLRESERHWAEQAQEDELSSFHRHGAISRRDLLRDVLSWLPKELDRLVIETRDEEDAEQPCCDHCDETAGHEPPCVLRSNVTGYDVAFDLAMDRVPA